MRRTAAWLIIAVACVVYSSCGSDDAVDASVDARDIPPVSWTSPVWEARYGSLAAGTSLDVTLRELGMSVAEAFSIGREVDQSYPVRQLRAGVSYALHVDEADTPVAFDIWPSPDQGVRVERLSEGWTGSTVSRPLDRYVQVLRGEITSSLSDAIVSAGGNAWLVLAVSDILQWDVDFFVEPRPGDTFELLVETWVDGQKVVSYGDVLSIEYDGAMVDAEAFCHRDDDGVHYYHADGSSVRRSLLKSPLNFRRISSQFSHRRMHPILRRYRPHLGVDYATNMGTPVVALGDGTVTLAATKGGFGKTVIVKHTGQLVTQYAHLSKYGKGVKKGTRVKQGEVIGYVGSTGLSTGPHLDFRCQLNGKWVNPLELERPVAEPLRSSAVPGFTSFVTACGGLIETCQNSGYLHWGDLERGYPAIGRDGDFPLSAPNTASVADESESSG